MNLKQLTGRSPRAKKLEAPAGGVSRRFALGALSGVSVAAATAAAQAVPSATNVQGPIFSNDAARQEINANNYGGVADGVTDNWSAFQRAVAALGAAGGVVRLGAGAYYFSQLIVPDYFTIRGSASIADQPRGTAYAYGYAGLTQILIPSTSFTATTTSDTPSGNVVHVSSLSGITAGMIVAGTGIYPQSVVYGTNVATTSITLNVNLIGDCPLGTTLTFRSIGINLGNSAFVRDCVILRNGIVTPAASAATAQTEVSSWVSGGAAVTAMNGSPYSYGCGVENCLIIGFYLAVNIPRMDRSVVRRTKFDCWNGLVLGTQGDIGYFEDNEGWGFYTANQPWSTDLLQYRGGNGFDVCNFCNDARLINCFAFAYANDFLIRDSIDVELIGCSGDSVFSQTSTAAVVTNGLVVQGASMGFRDIGGQWTSSTNNVVVNLYAYNAPANALTSGFAKLIAPVSFQSVAADYFLQSGGLDMTSPLVSAGSLGTPVVTTSQANYLAVSGADFSGGTGNAISLAGGSFPATFRWTGGVISGYTNNLAASGAVGDILAGTILSAGSIINFGTAAGGVQFQVNGGVQTNPAYICTMYGTNGGAHFGSSGGYVNLQSASTSYSVNVLGGSSTMWGTFDPLGLRLTTATGLSATGSTQSGALLLASHTNFVSTVALGTGVLLPASVINANSAVGLELAVFNDGANPLLVYPNSGATLNGGATNAAYSLAAGAHITVLCQAGTGAGYNTPLTWRLK